MKLRRLEIRLMPGIDAPFVLEGLGDGLHVILGPNGIGKSSLCRAMTSLLWSPAPEAGQVMASAVFESAGGTWAVERELGSLRWRNDGVEGGAPGLPPAHLAGCFFLGLRQLLDPGKDAGKDVAQVIREQMSGGYDLSAAAAPFATEKLLRKGRKTRKACSTADGQVRKAHTQQAQVAQRATSLSQLDTEITRAEEAQFRREHIERALELREHRELLEDCLQALAALPPGLEELTGKEGLEIKTRTQELTDRVAARTQAEQELTAAQAEAARCELEQPIPNARLSAARKRADSLADIETRLSQLRQDALAAQKASAEASQRIGGHAELPAELDLDDAATLFSFLRELQSVESSRLAIEERLRLLDQDGVGEEQIERQKQLQRGTEQLRIWLRSAPPGAHESAPEHETLARLFPLAGIVLTALGLVLGLTVEHSLFALAGLGLGLALCSWALRRNSSAQGTVGDARELARSEYTRSLQGPSSWTTEAVCECLQGLEDELGELLASAKRADRRDSDRANLGARLKALDEDEAGLAVRRAELAQSLGLEQVPPAAELVDLARNLDSLRSARIAEERAGGRLQAIEQERTDLLTALAENLRPHGEATPDDAALARAGVESLEKRDQALRSSLDKQESLRAQLQQLSADITRIEAIVRALYQGAGLEPGDQAGLARLLEDQEPYRKLCTERDGLEQAIARSERRLEEAQEPALLNGETAQLKQELASIDSLGGKLEELHARRAKIRVEVQNTRAGHALEEALASRDEVLEDLGLKREQALEAAAGQFLLDSVRSEHDSNQMPRVLERARELFGTFTHHAFELEVAPETGASFVAVEATSGARRQLSELSDGSRVQLALAARLAFAEDAEQGSPLPLFLDEALDHSDATRFQAIARSLARMVADDGRQIFYLTSDEQDAKRIQAALDAEGCEAARTIDLAAVRGRPSAVTGPEELSVAGLPEVPSPADMSAEQYGAALAVPRLDPRRPHLDQHLYFLLRDDLLLLEQLLGSRVERVGQWEALAKSSASLAQTILNQPGAGSELSSRAALLEVFCRAWSEGRGKPVGRAALEASGALSEAYLDGVAKVCEELEGNGEALLHALRERVHPALKGFRTKSADAIEGYLASEGYVDERELLDESGVLVRALASPAASRIPETATARMVHEWWALSSKHQGLG